MRHSRDQLTQQQINYIGWDKINNETFDWFCVLTRTPPLINTLTLTIRETIVTRRTLIALPSSDTVSAGTLTAVWITKPTTAV